MPAVVAAPSVAAEREVPPLPPQQPAEDDEPPSVSSSSSSSSSEDEDDFIADRKRKRADASKPRPPPALRWMRTPLNNAGGGGGAPGTSSSSSPAAASVPLGRVLGLDPRLAAHLRDALGHASLLPVQAAVWAAAAGGRAGAAHDLAVAAPTGSGKTLAYGLPLLHSLLGDGDDSNSTEEGRIRRRRLGASLGALVVVPTRDLAEQVAAVLGPAGLSVGLRTALIVGGGGGIDGGGGGKGGGRPPPGYAHPPSFAEEAAALVGRGSALRRGWCGDYSSPALLEGLEKGSGEGEGGGGGEGGDRRSSSSAAAAAACDVAVATPGRLAAHLAALGPSLARRALRGLRFLVVDEADRLLRQEYGGWAAALGSAAPAVGGGAGGEGGGGGGGEGEGEGEGEREDDAASFSALLWASRRRCARLAASATLTRDPAKLARLRLWRPRFVAVGGGWDRGEEEAGEEREEGQEAAEEKAEGEGVEAASDDGSADDGERAEEEEEEEEEVPPFPSSNRPDPPSKKQEPRYALPPGLSLRRVDVGGRGGANKPAVLLALLRSLALGGQRSVVFCASVAGAESVARFLRSVKPPLRLSKVGREGEGEGEGEGEEEDDGTGEKGASSVGLLAAGGAATPAERRAALRRFAAFQLPALVCSDGATRGLDLGAGGRTAVISYDPPAHAKALVHRAGRAVRGAGGAGGAVGGGAVRGGAAAGAAGAGRESRSTSAAAAAAAVGTAYTLLRPQDAAFHKELLRKLAGEGGAATAAAAEVGEAGEEQQQPQPFSPAAAQQLLKAFKLPRAALREARKEAEAAVERLSAAAAAAGGGAGRGL